jgi:hypothetical protein
VLFKGLFCFSGRNERVIHHAWLVSLVGCNGYDVLMVCTKKKGFNKFKSLGIFRVASCLSCLP